MYKKIHNLLIALLILNSIMFVVLVFFIIDFYRVWDDLLQFMHNMMLEIGNSK